jgi:hypothetical protein
MQQLPSFSETNSMEQSPSWEANSSSASQKIPRLIRNPKFYCRVHNSPSLVPVLSQRNPIYKLAPYFPKIHSNIILPYTPMSRGSSVGTALGYGLDDRGSRVRLPAGAGNFSLHHRVQNGSGAHPASYPMSTRGSFPGGKAAGA